MFQARPAYTPAIRAAADVGQQDPDLCDEFDVADPAAVADHQPIIREGLKEIFGREISGELIGRLHARNLTGTGPHSPWRGAPYTYVTAGQFLIASGLENLRDLPDGNGAGEAG